VKALERGALPERSELSPARRRLFETALALFSRDGYNGVSLRDIAKVLDLHPTAMYAHVGSKQELLFELVKMGHEELRDRIRIAVLETDGHPESQLRAIVHANALTHLTVPELARVCHSEYGFLSPEQAAVIDVMSVDLGSLLRDGIQRGITQGVFDPPDPTVARYTITVMGTRVVDWWTPELGIPIEHVAATQADFAVRLLTR
jgi:AcrR family transcriptional regulator